MRCLIIAMTMCALGAGALNAQPRIELNPEQLAFGVLQENETRHAQVTIRNGGDSPLRITNIQSTCYCTEASLAVRELEPGASTVMDVLFNSMNFQGRQLKFLKIASNDPRRSLIDYLVTADIKVPLYMEPHEALLQFPAVRAGQSESRSYTFRSEDVPRLEIEARAWPQDWLDIAVRSGEDPQTAVVDFTIRPDGAVGRYRERIRLATNVPLVPTIELEIDVRVVADLVLSMDRINLGVVQPGRPLQSRVKVTPFAPGTLFRLTGAEIDIDGLTASVVNEQNESYAIIEGEAMAGNNPQARARQGRVQGVLRIFSDLASTPELQVPVTYMIRR